MIRLFLYLYFCISITVHVAAQNLPKERNPGPWGELDFFPTYLEPPDHIVDLVNTQSERTIWIFPGKNPDQIRQFLSVAGIGEPDLNRLFATGDNFRNGPWIRLFPSPDLVEALPVATRTTIYKELAKYKQNANHRFPVIIESGDVAEWFASSGLKPETIRTIEQLSYPLDETLAFSEIPLLLRATESEKEEQKILKTTSRTASLIMRLRLTPESDFAAIRKYWNAGRGAALPLLDAFEGSPGNNYIDIIHLLPPLPRKYLYTFPPGELGVSGVYPDSFWIALNFFDYLPIDDFSDQESISAYLESCEEISRPYSFGDILVIENEAGQSIHASVFIADDIVYTKNGRSVLAPFMLMEWKNLLARISFGKQTAVRAFRRSAENL